jgi:DNA mismatch repair protein MutS
MVRDGGVFARGFDAELDELRALSENAGQFLVDLETRERARTGIANLRVEYNKVHGFYIEVTNGQADKVPDDYRRRQTLKNCERYITPELKAFEDKACPRRTARWRARSCCTTSCWATWRRTSPACRRSPAASPRSTRWWRWPRTRSATTGAGRSWWTRPASPSSRAAIRWSRTRSSASSPTTASCPTTRLLLITGPNMGGKSTFMRQVALITLLAYVGSYVPATSATIGPIDRIFTRIGASDDLANGRSTFMVEMTESAAILNGATEHSLVLMDEVGRGTSTFDGLALAWAIARHLIDTSRSFTLFATHYFELTQLPESHPSAVNVHLSAVEHKDSIVFLHAVQDGPASQSYGLQVAQLAGVPPAVIRAARKHLARLESQALDATPQLDLFAPAPCDDAEREAGRRRQRRPVPAAAQVAEESPALTLLDAIDPDALTPREALERLYELKRLASA